MNHQLTPREIEVLKKISEGKALKQVASELGTAHSTVKNQSSSIYLKLGAANEAHAVAIAKDRGII